MENKTLHEKTLEYLLILKKDLTVQESNYQEILHILSKAILDEEVDIVNSEINDALQSNQECSSCGETLEHWEKEICGPCKINDPRFADDQRQ
ncbi:hypothetical protein [Nitrosopumilus sp.]|uniref:hypothetical protein n=1 Tax=Nitrosopumilus sp. TaxID=2024843 RepID=UPI00292F59ED|nr:hypothetical protein [Nitrosopumilus sp.]